MKPELKAFLDSAEYLPASFRDFHDQKNLFKRLQRIVSKRKDGYTDSISWTGAQVYVIDVFLWYMAKHGYTLQKSRKRVPFEDLDADLYAFEEESMNQKGDVIRQFLSGMNK